MSSPYMPCIWRMVSVCKVLSDPVGMPVRSWKYFLRNVFPDRGNEQNAILLLRIGCPSKNIPSASKSHLLRSHMAASFDLNKVTSYSKLTVGVSGLALMCMVESRT